MILEGVEITGEATGNFPLDILEIIFFSGALVQPSGVDSTYRTQYQLLLVMKAVGTQMTYPEECKEEGVEGRVIVNFTIATDGKVTDVKVLRGVHEKLDAEAVRVITTSPDWAPGMHEGKAVPVIFTIPIVFKFNE